MNRTGKRAWIAGGAIVAIGLMAAPVLGFGFGRGGHHGRGDANLFMLARAAGVDRSQIASAFRSDATLKTAATNLKTAREALVNCLVSGGSCTGQISAYATAEQALAQEKMTVWGNLFHSAPNPKQAATVLGQLQQLQSQRRDIFKGVFGARHGGQTSSGDSES